MLIKRFLPYYKPYLKIFIMDLVASFLIAAIGMGYPLITQAMMEDFIPNKKIDYIAIFGVLLLVVYLLRAGLRYFIQKYGHIMGVHIQADMRKDLFTKLERLPYSYFDNHETGKIMSRMTNDLFDISELAHHGPENLFIASFTILGSFIYLMFINWILGLIVFTIIPLLAIITDHFRKKMKAAMKESKIAIAEINSQVESSVSGIRVTKAFTNNELEGRKFDKYNNNYITARKKVFDSMAKYFATSEFITDFSNIIVLIGGGIFLYYDLIDFADYSLFIISINLFLQPINKLIFFTEQLENGAAGFRRFLEIIDEKEEYEEEGKEILTSPKGHIEFKNVSFSYNDDNKEVLNHINLDIKEGQSIALIGPTGGGKTTICHLIPKFYKINEGEILLDDKNIYDFTLDSLRDNIGIVQQDVFLFNGTIKENIAYGNSEATDEEIIEAARKANILDYVNSLENGFDTNVGERGVKLSGGQKQRISIARAFLKNPSILILDEATSALDNTTELLIQNALSELIKGRTTIIVAHRLSTIKNVDKIFVVSNGTIVESGSHDELIKKNGIYHKLYSSQFKNISNEEFNLINDSVPMMS